MAMIKTLSQLKTECRKTGVWPSVLTGPGGKEARRDFVKALGDYHMKKKFPDGNVPWHLLLRREMESYQLAFQFTNLKPEEQRAIFADPDWVVEEKEDGVRMGQFLANGAQEGAYSRNVSVEDYLPVDYTDKLVGPVLSKDLTIVVDQEVFCSSNDIFYELQSRGLTAETQLDATTALLSMNTKDSLEIQAKFPLVHVVFDLLYYNGKTLYHLPWKTRRAMLEKIFAHLPKVSEVRGQQITERTFCLSEVVTTDKEAFLEAVLTRGGEGVIAKNINAIYTPTESRGRERFVKIKRTVSGSLGRESDGIDAFISGWELGKPGSGWEGLVGSLTLSVNVMRPDGTEYVHEIARVSNIPQDLRQKMTIVQHGTAPYLDPEYMGKVIEVEGQDISARAKRMTHARIIKWREDRSQFDCVMTEEELNSLIL